MPHKSENGGPAAEKSGWEMEGGLQRDVVATCRDFLKSLSQTAKLISLYNADHPVPGAALQECWTLFKRLCAAAGWPELTLALVETNWVMNATAIAEASQFSEALAAVFRAHGLRSLTFAKETRLFELAAFCKLAAAPPQAGQLDVPDFLRQRGVNHIRVGQTHYAADRQAGREGPREVVSPVPPAATRPETSPAPHRFAGLSFGSFVKRLVDESVGDPQERAQIYAEALGMVKKALEKRVSEATRGLERDKQLGLNQLARTEQVLSKVADGKVIVDKDGRVLMMDPVAEEISGKRLVDVAGKPILESVDQGEQVMSLAADLALSPDQPMSKDVRVVGNAEAMEAMRQSTALVQDEQGRVVGTYAVLPYVAKFKEAMRLQKEFVSHITHELKAPLSSICSALELVTDMAGAKLKPEEKKFLDISLRNSRQLRQMINEILDFSKLQSGKMTVNPVCVPAEPILREAVEGMRPWAVSKKLALEMGGGVFSHDGSLVLADHNRVVQILTNLISNAIKATPEGGRILVSGTDRNRKFPGQMVFSVKDSGCGIAKEDQEKIFQRFTQIEKDGRRREGVGLGLAIVKQLVDLHNGTLWLESEPGRGAAFCFSLPAPAGQPPV